MFAITESIQNQTVTLTLSGRFDFPARKTFQTALTKAQSTNPREIVLHFGKVSFIDSSGLGLLMLAQKNCQDNNYQLSLAVSPGYVMDVLKLANMDQHFRIAPLDPNSP